MKHLLLIALFTTSGALLAADKTGNASGPSIASALQWLEVNDEKPAQEVFIDIGKLIADGKVQPSSSISTGVSKENCWLLRSPNSPPELRWPTSMLNWRAGAPDLTLDLGVEGTFDIYAEIHAVDGEGAKGVSGQAQDAMPMAFTLEMDDGSKREVIGAKGFPGRHFSLEVFACHNWKLTGRKIILRSMGKPIYISGLRLVPTDKTFLATEPANSNQLKTAPSQDSNRKTKRWVATDHVDIVKEDPKHFAFPGVALLQNGDLAVVYREGTIHMNEPTGRISLSRSTDGGRTWLPRVTALDRINVDDRDPSIFQMKDGTVILTSADCLSTSKDFGRTWSSPEPTPVFGPHGAVEDEAGNIVYGALQRLVQNEVTRIEVHPSEVALGRTVGSRSVRLLANATYRSSNKGLSWEPVGVAAYTTYMPGPMDYVWLDEPFMCVFPNKFWIFSSRVDLDGFARIIRSPDRGKTWAPVIKTPVWGYPQHLLPLSDGRLLMTYGYRRPPFGVRACISNDEGKTWDMDNEIVIRMDGGTPEGQASKVSDKDLGYPVSVELKDGRIFTVYYFNSGGSNCYIAGTFWQPPTK